MSAPGAGRDGTDVAAALAQRLDAGGRRRTFGELTAGEVAARAEELGGATGFGHRSRVGAVAAAWRDLAATMQAQDAATVADLGEAELAPRLEPLWIVPPGGSLLP
jgi:hypothetical protein